MMAGGRAVGRVGTVVEHVDLGPVALALVKRGLPADTELMTGPDADIAAVIDAESVPPADEVGAGGWPSNDYDAVSSETCDVRHAAGTWVPGRAHAHARAR
ncbi:folate-binding YgfZ domain protein [Mycobacterium kansasii]|uniref:Folate-binding YgfZ domain protein n=1 Tax=Mycobacterium kansasii TaxID=1768 RepID=A0A1V3WV64_MYCKA|nr:folate-binding YgfZ domain protein [Mycobacterium kansasii]